MRIPLVITAGVEQTERRLKSGDTFLAKRSEKREIPQLVELKPRISADQIVAAVRDGFDFKAYLTLQ
ncbi:hypothetical protein JY97_01555 [Alkalispirochaeta odontotermitis]|nr:hypothetical protein JY97_01555 [Alkalispirochaeta odontotermitis]